MEKWLMFFLLLICIVMYYYGVTIKRNILAKNKFMKEKGGRVMNELIKGYIGKDVILSSGIPSIEGTIKGTLKKIEDNWIEIETSSGSQLVNLDYISHVREYPKNKKRRKKYECII